jgi:hypothetical protein
LRSDITNTKSKGKKEMNKLIAAAGIALAAITAPASAAPTNSVVGGGKIVVAFRSLDECAEAGIPAKVYREFVRVTGTANADEQEETWGQLCVYAATTLAGQTDSLIWPDGFVMTFSGGASGPLSDLSFQAAKY